MDILKSNLLLLVIAIGLLPHFATGQISRNVVVSEREWGEATSGHLDSSGNGTLAFQRDGVKVTAQFNNRVCRAVEYDFERDDFETLNQLLGMNSGRHQWQPDDDEDSAPDLHPTKWIRSDQRFIARWEGGKLLISPPESEDEEPADPSAGNETLPESAPPPLPLPGDNIESVIEQHGQPRGIMRSGKTQIWIYHWGTVNIRDSEVVSVSR